MEVVKLGRPGPGHSRVREGSIREGSIRSGSLCCLVGWLVKCGRV